MGMMHLNGKGFPKNPDKASKYFSKAADLGLDEAMLMLGKMSMSGEGMVLSLRNAEKWLKKAAGRGNAEAAELLTEIRKASR